MTASTPPINPVPTQYWAPRSYVLPILVTIFCCLIGGIVAIVYTANANTAGAGGRIAEAESKARTARTWMIVSVAITVVSTAVWFIVGVVLAATSR